MKNKKKKVPLILALLIGVWFFISKDAIFAKNPSVIISAVQIDGTNANADFIELYNPTCEKIDISKWKLRKRISTGSEASIRTFGSKTFISAKGYFLWANSTTDFAQAINADASTKTALSNNYSIAILDNNDDLVDSMTWGDNNNPFSDISNYPTNPINFESLLKNVFGKFSKLLNYSPKNSATVESDDLILCPHPIAKEISVSSPNPTIYSDKIRINEILPDASEEYIELHNAENQNENLSGWILRDASKNGKYVFPENSIIKSADYFTVYKKDFRFALNNSGNETVRFFSPDEREVDSVPYSGSQKNVSYNFDGKNWRWSRFLTPNAKNKFNNPPEFSVKKDRKIFRKQYANFKAPATDKDNDTLKFVWDFGDGHKSYKKEARHKYEKAGKYEVALKVSDGSEYKIKSFAVTVKKFPKNKIEIVGLSPNPRGVDSKHEWIEVENKSNKKINLKNWSVVTGWKKMINHPITENFFIKPSQSKILTREHSRFVLGNKKTKLELRYPDGQIAAKAKYKSRTSIKEGVVYAKENKNWQWIDSSENKNSNTVVATKQAKKNQPIRISNVVAVKTTLPESSAPTLGSGPNKNVKNKFVLANNDPIIIFEKITVSSFAIKSVRVNNNVYTFTKISTPSQHYVVKFLRSTEKKINFHLNNLFSKLILS